MEARKHTRRFADMKKERLSPLPPLLLRIGEAADLAGCGRSTAYELAASGEWPTVETPYGRRVTYAGLAAWLDKLGQE